jgi:hypothetical protein
MTTNNNGGDTMKSDGMSEGIDLRIVRAILLRVSERGGMLQGEPLEGLDRLVVQAHTKVLERCGLIGRVTTGSPHSHLLTPGENGEQWIAHAMNDAQWEKHKDALRELLSKEQSEEQ